MTPVSSSPSSPSAQPRNRPRAGRCAGRWKRRLATQDVLVPPTHSDYGGGWVLGVHAHARTVARRQDQPLAGFADFGATHAPLRSGRRDEFLESGRGGGETV